MWDDDIDAEACPMTVARGSQTRVEGRGDSLSTEMYFESTGLDEALVALFTHEGSAYERGNVESALLLIFQSASPRWTRAGAFRASDSTAEVCERILQQQQQQEEQQDQLTVHWCVCGGA